MMEFTTRPQPSPSVAPTIYLSFGGVLNVGHGVLDQFGGVTLDTGRPLFEYAPYLIDVLAPYSQVQIVLTTSWLHSLGAERTIALLPDHLLRKVVSTTLGTPPRLGEIKDGTAKTMSIMRHAARHGVSKWLALDDDAWGVPSGFEEHFLHTDSEKALGSPEARKQLREWLETACKP